MLVDNFATNFHRVLRERPWFDMFCSFQDKQTQIVGINYIRSQLRLFDPRWQFEPARCSSGSGHIKAISAKQNCWRPPKNSVYALGNFHRDISASYAFLAVDDQSRWFW